MKNNIIKTSKKFVDEIGTVFTKGPFDINGIIYDFLLEDANGIDYCSIEQIENWNIKIIKFIE